MNPTREQEEAVALFLTQNAMKVEALAGTGKTSTLIHMSNAMPRAKGQYMAFNNSIAAEAKSRFGPQVNSATTHELAFKCLLELGYSREKLSRAPNTLFYESLLRTSSYELPIGQKLNGVLEISRRNMARLIHKTFQNFFQSADLAPGPEHLPDNLSGFQFDEVDSAMFFATYGRNLSTIWERMQNDKHPFPLGHDGYLKVWSLLRPQLEADYIMLDEVQDTSDVILDLLGHQSAPVVYVGDSHQQIYEWRGAIDAISKLTCTNHAKLTTSFRFGPEIARLAGGVVNWLGSLLSLRGFRANDQITNDPVKTRAVLCRYNRTVMQEASRALMDGSKVHIIGGLDELKAMNEALECLQSTGISDHMELFGFHSMSELETYCECYPDSAGFAGTILKLRRDYDLSNILANLCPFENDAEVVLSTVHKAKGREWESVRLSDDLKDTRFDIDSDGKTAARLRYVAATRACSLLSLSPMLEKQFRRNSIN